MTDEEIRQLEAEFTRVSNDCQRFCFAARAREFQAKAIDTLLDLETRLTGLKTQTILARQEDFANQLLSMQNRADALLHELRMWVALKDDEPSAAWTEIIEAQSAIRSAMQAHQKAQGLTPYVEHLYALEELLFPPQTFMSAGLIIHRSTCSICGAEYGDCDHVVGRPYMGQLCARHIEEADIREISVVPEPANKLCRVITITDEQGTRDLMTWRLTSDPISEQDASDHPLGKNNINQT